jgi:hypothetical protein
MTPPATGGSEMTQYRLIETVAPLRPIEVIAVIEPSLSTTKFSTIS